MAAPAVIDAVFKTWDSIVEKKENNRKFRTLTQELKMFGIDDRRAQLNADITLAQMVFKDRAASPENKQRLRDSFDRIDERLHRINSLVHNIIASTGILKWHERSQARRELKDTLEQMTASSREFHQLVMSFREIAQSDSLFFLEREHFSIVTPEQERIHVNSTTFFVKASRARPGTASEINNFIIESKPYLLTQSMKSAHKDMRLLAQKLSAAQPRSGILPLVGYLDEPAKEHFQLVFRVLLAHRRLKPLRR